MIRVSRRNGNADTRWGNTLVANNPHQIDSWPKGRLCFFDRKEMNMGTRIMLNNMPFRVETIDNNKKSDKKDQSPQLVRIVKSHPRYNLYLKRQMSIFFMIDECDQALWN